MFTFYLLCFWLIFYLVQRLPYLFQHTHIFFLGLFIFSVATAPPLFPFIIIDISNIATKSGVCYYHCGNNFIISDFVKDIEKQGEKKESKYKFDKQIIVTTVDLVSPSLLFTKFYHCFTSAIFVSAGRAF